MRRPYIAVLALTAALLLTLPASGSEKADVALPDTVAVEGATLVLNGIALREKFVFDVYVAALYLSEKNNNATLILEQDAPRMMVMHFVRNVDAKSINKAWLDGLAANAPDASAELKAKFAELCLMMEDIKKGQEMGFAYTPATGTDIMVAGQTRGGIPGKDFADAILATWIGPKPGPGEKFKAGLLGK
ncbi:MAG: chalcone isomerase family protein [Pseudodesulfovibrio sp.]